MGECVNCRWWIPPGFLHNSDVGASDTMGVCQLTVLMTGQPLHPESLARARDEDGWKAVLNTLPTFGCNQYAPDVAG